MIQKTTHIVILIFLGVTAPQFSQAAFGPIGYYSNGCIDNSEPLALSGLGYEVMAPSRARYFGHDDMNIYIRALAQEIKSENLGALLIGDIGQKKGGRMPEEHASHQNGLDVDLWLWLNSPAKDRPILDQEREDWEMPEFVNLKTKALVPGRWTQNHIRLFQLATAPDNVQRIFIHPRIKKILCDSGELDDRSLRKIRPWTGHHEHLHVRLKCPKDALECFSQDDPSEGNGCGKELDDWLTGKLPGPSGPGGPKPKPPKLCELK